MFELPTIHEGQFRQKSHKGGQMEVKVEAEHVAKFRNPVKFLQWSTFLQLEALISFRLLS